MGTIKLVREIDDEFAPRYYTMTGEFARMIEDVKGLRLQRFLRYSIGTWLVDAEGLSQLRDLGYEVEQDADCRVTFDEREICDGGDRMTVVANLEYREADGSFHSLLHHTLHVPLTAALLEETQVTMNAIAQEVFPDLHLSPSNRYQAVRELAHLAVRDWGVKAVALFEETTQGDRCKQAFEAGLIAMHERFR